MRQRMIAHPIKNSSTISPSNRGHQRFVPGWGYSLGLYMHILWMSNGTTKGRPGLTLTALVSRRCGSAYATAGSSTSPSTFAESRFTNSSSVGPTHL